VDGDAKPALFSAPSYGADARPLIGQEEAIEGVRQNIASAFAQHRARLSERRHERQQLNLGLR